MAADRLGLFARSLLRRLFKGAAQLHFAEYALALHLLLQRLECLVDVIVAYDYLNDLSIPQLACELDWSPHLRHRAGLIP